MKPEYTRRLNEALGHIKSSPLGSILHREVQECDSVEKFYRLIRRVRLMIAPRMIEHISGVEVSIQSRYYSGKMFPDLPRLLALLKMAHFFLVAQDQEDFESLGRLPKAKTLHGKEIPLKWIALEIPQETGNEVVQLLPAVRKPKGAVPPNLIGSHLAALQGVATALNETIRFCSIELSAGERTDLAQIIIDLAQAAGLTGEDFRLAFHGQPLGAGDSGAIELVRILAGSDAGTRGGTVRKGRVEKK